MRKIIALFICIVYIIYVINRRLGINNKQQMKGKIFMGMTFWDTVAGYHLAEVLTRELPKLNKNLNVLMPKKTEQKVERMHFDKVFDYLCQEIAEGRKLVNSMQMDNDVIIVTD